MGIVEKLMGCRVTLETSMVASNVSMCVLKNPLFFY